MPIWVKRLFRLLASRRLATLVLVAFVGFIAVTTFVPFSPKASAQEVSSWRRDHPTLAALVGPLGLHDAYESPLFNGLTALLIVSTTVCAWERTRAARRASANVRSEQWIAKRLDRQPTASILLARSSSDEALEVLATRLRRFRMSVRVHGNGLVARQATWATWGSAVFHWSMVALALIAVLGYLFGWRGAAGAIVGVERSIDPASLQALSAGVWSDADEAPTRTLKVESLDLDYSANGVDVGHAPMVVVTEEGREVARSRVYPNSPLRHGGLYVHRDDWGIGALVSFETTAGVEVGRTQLLFLFDSASSDGRITFAARLPEETGSSKATVTLPLDRLSNGRRVRDLPRDPRIEVAFPSSTDATSVVMRPGDVTTLPGANVRIRVPVIDRYSRLFVVYDPTIGLAYLAFTLAACAAAIALLVHPRTVIANASADGKGSVRLNVVVISKRIDTLFRKRVEDAVHLLEVTASES